MFQSLLKNLPNLKLVREAHYFPAIVLLGGIFLTACTATQIGQQTAPTPAPALTVPKAQPFDPSTIPNVEKYYDIKNYIKGVHYKWEPVFNKNGDAVDENNERIDTTGDTATRTGSVITSSVLPDGSTAWGKIVASILRDRGFSASKIKRYSRLSNKYEYWRHWKDFHFSECFSKTSSKSMKTSHKDVLNLGCVAHGSLPTEYNVETGQFLGYDPYKFAKRIPDCYKHDETSCKLIYSSYHVGPHRGWSFDSCKLLPKQRAECKKIGFAETYPVKTLACDEFVSFDSRRNCKVTGMHNTPNSHPGCYSEPVYLRIGCAPMPGFEPPVEKEKTKLVFSPKKHLALQKASSKKFTKRLYKIAPGHYCPPADDLVACDGREDTKVVYVEQ